MKIIVDAMGGDNAPLAPVEGALRAAEDLGVEIILTGPEAVIRDCLTKLGKTDLPQGVEIAPASEVITMEDNPARAFKDKPDSSMTVGLNLLKAKKGDAFVSAGSTGALLSAATLLIKRIRGIRRAALAPVVPTANGKMVLIDCDTLRTLDARQVGAGLGEVIKYGCIADEALFEKIERLGSREALAPELDEIIARCCAIKARYVHEDPHDHGVRMQLNFGHTLAHALENTMGYGVLLHGEAVCIGMVAAAGWGETLGVTPAGTGARIERLLKAYGLPTERDERLTRAHLAAVMALDKKAEGDGVRCVLLTKIGACTGAVIRGAQLEALL